jgi:hypothetical protein
MDEVWFFGLKKKIRVLEFLAAAVIKILPFTDFFCFCYISKN